MKKISVLMPTYNDSKTIMEAMDSIVSQSYDNWELMVIDDGSSDETKDVVNNYIKDNKLSKKVKYIYQDNADQLKALINGMQYIKGDYVYILHSDDILASDDVFEKAINYLDSNEDVDAIMSDLIIIDKDSKEIGRQNTLAYTKKDKIPAIMLLWLGRNLYMDMSFFRKDIFVKNVYNNYLIWNRPYWLNIDDNSVTMLNVKKVDFAFFKYRISDSNYANNEIGKLCLINGELRTALFLMKYYKIPFYKLQYLVFRVFAKLNLLKFYHPIYFKKETKNIDRILDFIIKKRYPMGYEDNIFFQSLVSFFQNRGKRVVDFDKLYDGEEIYLGNSFRKFNKQLINNELPKLYIKIFEEMKQGFNELVVSKKNEDKAINLMKFLCVYPYVKIVVRSSKNGEK